MPVKVSPLALLAIALLAFLAQQACVQAQHAFPPHLNYRRVANQNGLRAYQYSHDVERFRSRAIAVADPVRIEEWFEEYGVSGAQLGHAVQRSGRDEAGTLIPDNWKGDLVRRVARKPFHFTTAALVANNATLEQVGLTIYDTGRISATGRISHDGGPDGSLGGANVNVILRAYASPTPGNFNNQLPVNSSMVWHSRLRFWVSRNQSEVTSLVCPSNGYVREFRQNFNQITHFEVELEAERDR
jgi:hypothetical protein